MATVDPTTLVDGTDNSGYEDYINSILNMNNSNAEANIRMAEISAETTLEQQKRGHDYLKEGTEKAREYYQPYMDRGKKYLGEYDTLMQQGAPKYSWDKKFDYENWKWDKKFDYEGFDEFSKRRLTKENMADSPYYGLYKFQSDEQQSAIDKMLRARGLHGSGAGMKEALSKSTAMDERFTASEYDRSKFEYSLGYDQELQNYMMDYEQSLQKHNIGYEEARQKYGMDYDQYLKKFGSDYGAYQDKLAQLAQQGNYGWMSNQAVANLYKDQGSQLNQSAIQTGQTLAALQSSNAQTMQSAYNAQQNTMANLYNAQQNRNLTSTLANQAQNNWNTANNANQTLGYATLGTNLARTGLDAYRYYNQPANTSNVGNLYNYPGTTSMGTVPSYQGTNADSALWW